MFIKQAFCGFSVSPGSCISMKFPVWYGRHQNAEIPIIKTMLSKPTRVKKRCHTLCCRGGIAMGLTATRLWRQGTVTVEGCQE